MDLRCLLIRLDLRSLCFSYRALMVSLVLRERLETMVPREMLVLLDLLELQVHLDLRYRQQPEHSFSFVSFSKQLL